MRRLSVIAIAVVLAAAGLAAIAWQGPRALDWSHLEPRLQEALGREVSLDGPVRLDLLPRPVLTVAGISAIDISVREARAVLDTGALLAGSLEIDRLEFSGVELTFDRSLVRPLPPLPAQHIRFEDSSIAFGDAVVPVETATLTVRGPEGPYRLEAKAALNGRPVDVTGSVGKWRDRTSVTVSVGDGGIEAVAAGAVEKNPAAGFVFSGRFSLRGAAGSAWNGKLDSEFLLGPDGARFTGIDAVVADQRFTGAIRADWRGGTEIDARLSTRVLLFDRWRDLLPQLAGWTPGASLRLALNAGAVRFGDRTARKVEAAFRGDADGFRMERLAAALPGGTRVELAGEGHESAAFSLKTRNLRALLQWLGIDPGAVEEARLRGLEANGRLRLAGRGVSPEALRARFESADFAIEEVRGRFDGARIEGGFGRREGQFEARLEAEDLPLDAYRPALEGRGLYPGRLHLDLARTRLLGVPAARMQLAAELGEDGDIVLTRLAVEDAGGVSGEASGRFGGKTVSFRVAGRTTDLDRSARLHGLPLPVVARGLGAVEFEGRGEGLSDLLPIDVRAEAGGRTLRLSGELSERKRFAGRVRFEGPLPPRLQPPDNDSPVVAAASVSAGRDRADFTDIEFRLGRVRVQGTGTLSLDGGRPAVRAALAAGRVDLPAPSPNVPVWRRRPLETGRFGAFDLELDLGVEALGIGAETLEDVKLGLSLSPEAWLVKAAMADWRGGRLAFDGGYLAEDGRAGIRLEVRDAVLPDHAGPGPSGARTNALLDLAAEGRSPHELVSTLSGKARFEFSGGRLNGLDPAAAESALDESSSAAELLRRLRQALVSGSGQLVSGRFEARMESGVARPVAGNIALAAGRVAVSGSADLGRRLLDLTGRLAFPDRPDTPPLGFSVAGPLHDPDRVAEVEAVEALLLSAGLAGLVRPNAN